MYKKFLKRAQNLDLPSWAYVNWKNEEKSVYEKIIDLKTVSKIAKYNSTIKAKFRAGKNHLSLFQR